MQKQDLTWQEVDIDIAGRSGGEVQTTCPRCSKDRKKQRLRCLSVNLDEGIWYCHHCGRAGSLKRGWTDEPQDRSWRDEYQKPWVVKPTPEATVADKGWEWLKSRGISRQVAEAERVVVTSTYSRSAETEVPAIAYTYWQGDEHVHTKYRGPDKTFWSSAGTRQSFYRYDAMFGGDPWEPVVICEGEMDALSCVVAGITRAVSVPMGAPNAKDKDVSSRMRYMDDDRVMDHLMSPDTTVVLAVDIDEPGKRLQQELARRIGSEKCRMVIWPDDCKDANDVLLKHGVQKLRDVIANAEPFPVPGLVSAREFSEEALRMYRDGLPQGLSTGWKVFDGFVRMMFGQMWIVHGQASSGKSHFVNHLLLGLINQQDMGVALFSPEWWPPALHELALAEVYIGKSSDKLTYPGSAMDEDELKKGLRWVEKYFHFITTEDRRLETILELARIAIFRHGVKVIVVDPWTELHHEYGFDKLAYYDTQLTKVTAFCKAHNVSVIIVAHPPKPIVKPVADDGTVLSVPNGMYGVAGAAAFANKADVVIEVVRDYANPGIATTYIQKVRMKHLGHTGQVKWVFYPESCRFRAIATQKNLPPPKYGNGEEE